MVQRRLFGFAAVLSLSLLAACGGGGGEGTTKSALTAVKVMGDSLSDSGAFRGLPSANDGLGMGRIFSVQASPGTPTNIWTERLADLVGAPALCNFFSLVTPTSPNVSCGSFAVGGGRINNRYMTAPVNTAPFSITTQIATAASLGNFKTSDLLLIDGGGNDVADLIGAYLKAAQGNSTPFVFMMTKTLNPVSGITTAVGNADLPTAATLYMQALADEFYDSIKTNALDKGATHVAVLNIPAVTKTPRFQMVLGSLPQANRAPAETLFNGWIKAFNDRLASKFSGDSRVVVVDFYAAFLDQVAHPSQYGLTNVTDTVCPVTGRDTDGLPKYDFETCTAASLSATAGKSSPDWWKTYAFSDGFHPTPYGYQLMSQLVARSLAQAGWIQ
ncbi:SGNH/GDSL hydrolase family protein [Limnohabitans sp.]|uniref:SGNH/GDSL hydrolase family protein n=1 Tax=Limnohabitans sp. TaxID=1907725 RepID=UPI00286F97A3|nr:SGNH/GDSL hydrolase family protein [Limnohabitans sp.]